MKGAPRERILWPFLLAGYATLLVAAHFDSIRGPLLPPVARELHLEYGESAWFLAVCHATATGATGLMIAALNRWPERRVTVATALVGCACAAMATQVHGFAGLMGLAVLVGATISTMGAIANVLVLEGSPDRMRGRMLAGLHAMYGFGSMLATWSVGAALRAGIPWFWLYVAGLPGLLGLIAFALYGMKKGDTREAVAPHSAKLSGSQVLVVALISVYVAGEANASIWLSSYLVGTAGYGEAAAASATTVYFGVLTAVRVACFLLLTPEREVLVLVAALAVPVAAFAGGYLGGQPQVLLLMGVFGAFYPVFLARVSRRFPDQWRSVAIWAMTIQQLVTGLGELAVGKAADAFGMRNAFLVPGLLLAAAFILLLLYLRDEVLSSSGKIG